MFKPTVIQKRSWWVPCVHPLALAVPLDDPARYREAVQEKVEKLVRVTPLAEAQRLVGMYCGPTASVMGKESLDEVKVSLLQYPGMNNLLAAGDPARVEPLEAEYVDEVVKAQADLRLEDVLEAMPSSGT